jgi:hypothetical protein
MPGILSTVLARMGQWLWTRLISPLLDAVRSFGRWFSNLLVGVAMPIRPADSAAGQPADRLADVRDAQYSAAARTDLAPAAIPAKSPTELGTTCAATWTQVAHVSYRDLATRWQGLGAELSAGLRAVQREAAQDDRAASYMMGLHILLRQVESAVPQLQRLATGTQWGARDREGLRTFLLQSLLPVLDTLHRGQQAFARDHDQHPIVSKVRMLYMQTSGQFQRLLAMLDVREVNPVGQRFDPSEQEALASTDGQWAPRGHVEVVFLPGFWHGAQLLRPAQVGVAQ